MSNTKQSPEGRIQDTLVTEATSKPRGPGMGSWPAGAWSGLRCLPQGGHHQDPFMCVFMSLTVGGDTVGGFHHEKKKKIT